MSDAAPEEFAADPAAGQADQDGAEEDRRDQVLQSVYDRYRNRGRFMGAHTTRAPRKFGAPGRPSKRGGQVEGEEPDATPGLFKPRTGARASKWDPQSLGSLVGKMAEQRGWEEPLSVASVVARWPDIVGQNVADHCPIESFEDRTLVARADSSAWAQQLRLLIPRIQARIDEEVGVGVVTRVVVKAPTAPSWSHGPRSVRGPGPRDTYG